MNILIREKSFRMGAHFSKIYEKVSYFSYLNTTCAPSRLPVIPETLHQKSTQIQQNYFFLIKCDPKWVEKLLFKQTLNR